MEGNLIVNLLPINIMIEYANRYPIHICESKLKTVPIELLIQI